MLMAGMTTFLPARADDVRKKTSAPGGGRSWATNQITDLSSMALRQPPNQ